MRHTKEQQVTFLFSEIGLVSDRFVAEAMPPQKQKKTGIAMWSRWVAVAACLAICVTVIGLMRPLWNSKGDPTPPGDSNNAETPLPTQTLDSVLASKSTDAVKIRELSSLSFQSGNAAYVVWQRADGGQLYASRALSSSEINSLTAGLNGSRRAENGSPAQEYRIWFCYANGEVRSPYLPNTPGNTSMGTLFDYEAELIPTKDFISLFEGMME